MTGGEAAHAIFDPIAAGYLTRPDVDIGPMFGSEGLRVRGKVFAFVGYRGGLVVKVPQGRADEIVESGAGERMVMRERAMREWVLLPLDAGAPVWTEAIADAFAYVDRITPGGESAP